MKRSKLFDALFESALLVAELAHAHDLADLLPLLFLLLPLLLQLLHLALLAPA